MEAWRNLSEKGRRQLLILLGLVAVLTFVIWVVNGVESPIDWEMLVNVATVFTAIIAFFAAIVVVLQLEAAVRATEAQTYAIVLDRAQNEDIREARRLVFQELEGKEVGKWSEAEIKAAELVCYSYDEVGQMVRNKYLRKKVIIDNWGPSLRKSWSILSPLVKKYRQDFKAAEYWDDFEWLAKEASHRS